MPGMETLQSELFERPFYIYFALAFVELGVVVWWRAQRTPWRTAALAAAPLLAAGVFLTARLVVTERERIEATLETMVADVNAGHVAAMKDHLSETMETRLEPGGSGTRTMSREQVVAWAARSIENYGVEGVRIERVRTAFPQPRAGRMQLALSVGIKQGPVSVRQTLNWLIYWRKQDLQWQMYRVEMENMGF